MFTCKLLLRSATATGTSDYEGLSAAVGGPWLKVRALYIMAAAQPDTHCRFDVGNCCPGAPTCLPLMHRLCLLFARRSCGRASGSSFF